MEQEQDQYYAAEVITWLLFYVNPAINKAATFELIFELLTKGMDKRSVKKYGQLVHKTAQISRANGKEVH